MRKIIIVIFVFIFSCLFCLDANAEEIKCEYKDIGLTMTWDTEKKFNARSNPFVEMKGIDSKGEVNRKFLWIEKKSVSLTKDVELDQNLYKEVMDNFACNSNMYVCIYLEKFEDSVLSLPTDLIDSLLKWNIDTLALEGVEQKLVIMTEKEFKKSNYAKYTTGRWYYYGHDKVEERWTDKDGWFGSSYNFGDILSTAADYIDGFFGVGAEHHQVVYKETSCTVPVYDGPYIGVNINCSLLNNKVLKFMKKIQSYKNCGKDFSCKTDIISKIKEMEDEIKAQCRTYFENYDYSGEQAQCIDACMTIRETLNEYKKGTDLYEDLTIDGGDCGFSSKLLVLLSNILKWVKYILPVIVIVLGILDFIKAIASEKEDEMKKAQKGFITRLIAASLVFIIPLIIEFILIKMGFTYDACSLFDYK